MDGCKVYMTSNGSCSIMTWTNFKSHLMQVGLAQNRETMALGTLTTVDLFYLNTCEDPHESKFIERAFGWGPGHIWFRTTHDSWGSVTTLHGFGGVLGRPFIGRFLLSSHNFMVTDLGSCVKAMKMIWIVEHPPASPKSNLKLIRFRN